MDFAVSMRPYVTQPFFVGRSRCRPIGRRKGLGKGRVASGSVSQRKAAVLSGARSFHKWRDRIGGVPVCRSHPLVVRAWLVINGDAQPPCRHETRPSAGELMVEIVAVSAQRHSIGDRPTKLGRSAGCDVRGIQVRRSPAILACPLVAL